MKVGRRRIDVSNRDKVFFPEHRIDKGELVDYYHRAAAYLLPHARDRLVSMHRFPDGIDGPGFFHKDVPEHFPAWIHTERVEKSDGHLRQLVIDDAATLVYIADQGCITPHVWLSRLDRRDHPDRMIFDLDPPSDDPDASFDEVRWTARRLRALFEEIGLVAFVMTSGSKGLHLHVPLDRSADFDAVRSFAMDAADLLVERHPERLTRQHRKAKRGDRVYLDVMRNGYAQTTVAPYAVRALEGAPVATPLSWDELDRSDLHPRRYGIGNLFRRMARKDDPWKGMGRHGRSLEAPARTLRRLRDDARASRP
jgi:bifunctional non-homologous end joining protein LigD